MPRDPVLVWLDEAAGRPMKSSGRSTTPASGGCAADTARAAVSA